jgi:outer membrane protein
MKKLIVLALFAIQLSAVHAAQDLDEIFELALASDPRYQEVRAVRDATLETRPQAIARLLPLVSAQAATGWNYLFNKKNTFQGAGTQKWWAHTASVALTQPVFNWRFWVQLSQSDNQIAQSEADYANALQDLTVRTIRAYLDVLVAQDTLEFAAAERKSLARQLEQAQQRFDVGLIAITDVLEAQSGFDRARSREIFAANEVDNAKEALREIIGDNPADLVPLKANIPLLKPDPLDIDEWSTVANNQNLGIIAAINQAEFARKTIEIQRSGHYPTIDLLADYSFNDVGSLFGLRGNTGRVGVQLNVPIFEGGAVNSRTRQAQHDYVAARDNLHAVHRAVTRQVKDAYRTVLSTISQVESLRATVRSSVSSLEATSAGFEVGTRTAVDLVNEERNLFDARRNLSVARRDYIVNWVLLKEAASNVSHKSIETINELLGTEPFEPEPGQQGEEEPAAENEAAEAVDG